MAPGPSIDSAPPSAAEGGGRIAGGPPVSERLPREGQEWPPPRAVSGSAEAAKEKGRLLRPKCKRDGRQRLPQEDPEKLGTQGLPSKPGASGPSAPPQEDHVRAGLARGLSLADSRALRRRLFRTTLCLSARDANKDFFFKQTGSVYGGRGGGGAGPGHEAGRRPEGGWRRRR